MLLLVVSGSPRMWVVGGLVGLGLLLPAGKLRFVVDEEVGNKCEEEGPEW